MSPWPRSRPSTASSKRGVCTRRRTASTSICQPKDKVRNLKRDDAGCEIRGTAGYVLLPGSGTPFGAYRWDPELRPDKVTRAPLPAHVQAYVAGTPMKGNGAGQLVNPSREMASGQAENPQIRQKSQWRGWPTGQPL